MASFHLERCLGAYPLDFARCWTPPEYWDAADIALEVPEYPNIWTDGSREDFSSIGGFEVAGAGVYLPASELAFDGSVWGTAEECGNARLERCSAFMPLPGVMQTVQRAEFWGAIVALQAYWPCHLGIDNLNVVRSIGSLLDADCLAKPLALVKDGDLIALVRYMVHTRGRDTVRVTKVKGHAEDVDVQQGRVRLVDKQGNAEADVAADLGRRHQDEILIDARRRLLGARSHWYPIMVDLHRFMIAIARVSVNHDGRGGTAPDPLVWDQGSKPKVRKPAVRVNVDLASLPGPPGFLNCTWIQIVAGHISDDDIAAWPYSVGILVRFTAFLSTLHWPSGSVDLSFHLERCLGAYPADFVTAWTPPDYWDANDIALEMPEHPNIWTDGSREDFSSIGGFEGAGAGVYLPASEIAFDNAVWGTVEEYGNAQLERCRACLPVPGVLQTVQRAEFWGAILAMQAYWLCHLGIDNLNVVRSIGRLLDHDSLVTPLPLVKDGDLIALVQYMIRTRGRETVRVTKVKGHAEDVDVQLGRVRLVDQQGNAEADTAADLLVKILLLGRTVLVFCLGLLLFLIPCNWPTGSDDFGHFGVSFLELLILFEQWAGHRLLSEKVTWPHVRANRPILIPSVSVSQGIEIRHGCQFLSSLVRALAKLPGGLGRFLPCSLGSHLSRLRHVGWNQCSHGLNSRPLESCHHQCLLNGFLRQVVVSRRDDGIRRWNRWLREDLSSRPYAWLRPDSVPPSFLPCC